MKFVRKRLTYANVMSSIAVFLVLAGGTAFAAAKLGKNTVGSKQLKNNAVTSAKIKKGAVTGSKIAKGAVGATAINTTGLIVPNATHASTADSATSATNAGNANTVGGQTVVKVFKTLVAGQTLPVASVGGFTITAACEKLNVDVTLTTPSNAGSVAWASGNGYESGAEKPYFEYDSAKVGKSSEIRIDGNDIYGQASFDATMTNGLTLSGVLGYDYETFDEETPEQCVVAGQVILG
jgi:hypothetical protein